MSQCDVNIVLNLCRKNQLQFFNGKLQFLLARKTLFCERIEKIEAKISTDFKTRLIIF